MQGTGWPEDIRVLLGLHHILQEEIAQKFLIPRYRNNYPP
jgi:hypothetical protein